MLFIWCLSIIFVTEFAYMTKLKAFIKNNGFFPFFFPSPTQLESTLLERASPRWGKKKYKKNNPCNFSEHLYN